MISNKSISPTILVFKIGKNNIDFLSLMFLSFMIFLILDYFNDTNK